MSANQKPDRSAALQHANSQVIQIKQMLELKKDEIRFLLGDDVKAMKLVMSALMKANDDPKIRECTPQSVVRAVIQAALCGADLSAGVGEGYLVPFNNKDLGVKECTFMPGYRLGQRHMQEATGMRVIANVVRENDEWEYSEVPLVLRHKSADGDRGKLVRSYAVTLDDDGRVMFAQIATAEDIEQVKKASRKGRDYDSPAWRDWEERMWRKVPIMRLAKEVRAWRPSVVMDRLLEAEAMAFQPHIRAELGDLPAPQLLPKTEPTEGRAKVGGRKSKPAVESKPDKKPEPEAKAEPESTPPVEADSSGDDQQHDPETGKVAEPWLCSAPECEEQAIEGESRCTYHKKASVEF